MADAAAEAAANKRARRVVIDSGARDPVAYPSPSYYEVQLQDDLDDVHEVRLLAADLPFPGYLLPAALPLPGGVGVVPGTGTSVALSAASWAQQATASMEPGDYASAADLASGLSLALQAAADAAAAAGGAAVQLGVTVDARLSKLVVWATAPFTLGPADRAVARALGLPPQQLSSQPDASYVAPLGLISVPYAHSVRAPYRAVLQPDAYAVLSITPNAEALLSPTDAVHQTFAVLPRLGERNLTVCVPDAPFTKSWTPPIARIARVGVRLTDRWGNPFDAHNQDHRIELEFVCSKSRAQRFAIQAGMSGMSGMSGLMPGGPAAAGARQAWSRPAGAMAVVMPGASDL